MLFGMAEELRAAVAGEGYRTRVYVPVGAVIPGMAYLVRRLLENTSNQSWFVREATAESPEVVLARPQPAAKAMSEAEAPDFRNAAPAAFFLPGQRGKLEDALGRMRSELRARVPAPYRRRMRARSR